MTRFHHRGYNGTITDVEADGSVFGVVDGLRDVVTFEAETAAEAEAAFQASVDDYLAFCADRGEAPERPLTSAAEVRR
jgi:predicted HicB family RNase H-like nuclease